MQILVLGMHRSGTSLITRIINMMGAYFGPEGISLGYNQANPKGFWERRDAMRINDELLRASGASWDKPAGWNAALADTLPPPLQHAIHSLVLEMDAHRPWVLKDPRLCLTLPCFMPWLEVPVAVIAARHPQACARSLSTRNQIPPEYGLALWEYYATQIIRNAHGLPKLFVEYETMLADPVKSTQALYAGLCEHATGLRLPSEREILAFVEPALNRSGRQDGGLTPHQQLLYAMLRGETPFDAGVDVSAGSMQLLKAAD